MNRIKSLLVDPSLFTAPYDAALTQGLLAAGVEPRWAVRPTRRGDRQEIPAQHVDDFFYRRVDEALRLPGALRAPAKGIAHAWGLCRLVGRAWRWRPQVVHFQWTVIPPLDALAIRVLRRICPVVVTVHDTEPFNGERISLWQNLGFDLPLRWADHVIVHTEGARGRLLARGIPAERVSVVPHGPLSLQAQPSPQALAQHAQSDWTAVLFGELKPYKGVDVLIEAVALLPPSLRSRARFVVAGRPRMGLEPLWARARALGVMSQFEVTERRLSEQEMADLFARADCFVFPYRQIDASGVYFLTRGLGRWIIASRVGVFAEELDDGQRGRLVPPQDAATLAQALADALVRRPVPRPWPPGHAWGHIGAATRAVYERVQAQRPAQAVAARGGRA